LREPLLKVNDEKGVVPPAPLIFSVKGS